ncbi:hypothetical protein [Streptomyces sp. NPDC091217]|uniref:hypothetical protein n=1 Tax=Streptomyces sp. NPDC091217 TaxID=3365975 RepID=UPI0038257AAF
MSVRIPGALAEYLAVQYIGDEETRDALDAARRSLGRTLVIEPTSTRVLHVISRYAEYILGMPSIRTRAQRDAARLWIKRAGQAPVRMVHRFESTADAYDSTQVREDIRDGDVLVIESERAVGFLRTAWPVVITAEYGELHRIEGDPRTLDDGRYAESVEAAEEIAREHGFALAEQQLAAGEVEVAETVAPEVTRASVDAYLAREYPALFATEQPQPLALPPAHLWAVEHMVVIRGEWVRLAMCGMSLKEANDRAGVLRYTGSKAVEVVPCSHGPKAHPDEYAANRCQGCGYRIPRGEDWHDGCRPRPRPTPLDRARRAAVISAGFDRALEASARVADLDGEPPF